MTVLLPLRLPLAQSAAYLPVGETDPGGGGETQYAAMRFQGDAAYAISPDDLEVGDVGACNFEIQALVYIEGAYTSEDRVFMIQFPADRQAGLFVSNLFPSVALATGDSQAGSSGGAINGAATPTGVWCLMTFSADGDVAPAGLWRGSMESLDGSVPFSAGGRAKGVEDSLLGNRVDLNGGGVDNGWPNGIRYAEVRAYPAQRSDAQRQADLTRAIPDGTELFWWRVTDDGEGGVAVEDITGNGVLPTLVNGTLAVGPLF